MARQHAGPQILFIDANDSFSENIGALLTQTLNARITFTNIDASRSDHDAFETFLKGYDAIIIGPGPGNPADAADVGAIPLVWSVAQANAIPVLGICLGFQSLCLTFGAPVVRMPLPCHGLTKKIRHLNRDLFSAAGDFAATNYNSLAVRMKDLEELAASRPGSVHSNSSNSTDANSECSLVERPSENLLALAWDDFGWAMAVRHRRLPFWGLQFHPESCKSSEECPRILQRWWDYAVEWNNMYRSSFQKISPTPRFVRVAGKKPSGKTFFRDNDGAFLTGFISPLVTSKKSRSSGLEQLSGHLLRLAASSGSVVHMSTTKMTSPEHIAELCYRQSSSWTAILESTKKGRYSIYAIPSPINWRLELSSETVVVSSDGSPTKKYGVQLSDIFEVLNGVVTAKSADGGDRNVPFWGGFIGFFSYELGLQASEYIPKEDPQSNTIPEASLAWVERSVVIDNLDGRVYVQSIRQNDMEWVHKFTNQIAQSERISLMRDREEPALDTILSFARMRLPDEDSYKTNINACQQELRAGNSYELCLTVEAQVELAANQSWPLYKNLKRCNPVPFAAYIRLGKTTVLSSSPEQFLSWSRQGTIDMIPMKGTVKKTRDMTFAKASEILASPKESAENLMIADLIRHDLYRALGSSASVEVVKLCDVVEHETVYQLVSHIRANPQAETACLPEKAKQAKVISRGLTALQQTMPPGSMTGAPKKRSCKILSQLEQRPRGVYSGVLGYLDVGGGGGFSVCIRTAFSSDHETKRGLQTWRIGAGGAITVLSDADAEWEEMRTKMDSVLRAFRPRE